MKKRFQVMLDFEVDIDSKPIDVPQNQEQKRLFDVIMADKEKLDAYIAYQIAIFFECMNTNDWQEIITGQDFKNGNKVALAPAIAMLGNDDQEFFRKAEEDDLFYENVEDLEDCFTPHLIRSEVYEQA